jgi:hypothetical protein
MIVSNEFNNKSDEIDKFLDSHFKEILQHKPNGKSIEVDIIAHLEYFYNTQSFNFNETNPFENP